MSELSSYIATARSKHLSDKQIKESLLSAGWPEDDVERELVMPPPPPVATKQMPVSHVGMWVGFLYILFFIALYVLATAIAGIFHQSVDTLLPNTKNEPISAFVDNSYLMRGYIAAVIVSYPVFLLLALTLRKALIKQPLIKNLRSRKLLMYLTLIGTFLIMLCHVIVTLYQFLGGSLTENALAHLGVTFLIAGSLFGYFLSEVIYDRKTH